ncbi:MAG: histidine kinase [uncultured bacterium]|nr:MAG: histidine kinase [uncultured bacterium]
MNSNKYYAWFKYVRRMPLRTRLILAFVVLILSSASATIMIGNTVFSRTVDHMVQNKGQQIETTAMYAQLKDTTTTLFTSLIASGMIFGFIMTYLFSLWLVKPIAKLAEAMNRVAEGDLDLKVRIESADELGKLARAFNRMVAAIKERDYKLMEFNENRFTAVEKQISIGRLAAGVAHEINNPLTAVLSLSSLLYKKTSPSDPGHEDLSLIVTETTRCREIVRNLLDFARERPVEMKIIDINQVIRETIVLTKKYEELEKVTVLLELSPQALLVNADPKLMQQVFINLILNAAEATDAGGRIWVKSEDDSSGGFVQIVIKDTGKGIPREYRNRVFEPFFTTKGSRKGTGLGLSVSLGIIQRHKGTIQLDSEENQGTTMIVIIPRIQPPTEEVLV